MSEGNRSRRTPEPRDKALDKAHDRAQEDTPDQPASWTPPGAAERYHSLPGLAGLPGRIWRGLPAAGKVLLVLAPLAAVGLALALAPGIEDSKEDRARAEQRVSERRQAARAERTRAEQRPLFATGTPALDVAGRVALVDAAAASVERDARRRVEAGELRGPIRRVQCETYPRTAAGQAVERETARRYGRLSCLAVTAAFGPNTGGDEDSYAQSEAGAIGHPYRLRIDFRSGRYAYCKVSGRAGEGALRAQQAPTVPRVCGGR